MKVLMVNYAGQEFLYLVMMVERVYIMVPRKGLWHSVRKSGVEEEKDVSAVLSLLGISIKYIVGNDLYIFVCILNDFTLSTKCNEV